MGLIDRLKAALGLEPRESARTRQTGESSGQDVAVTVEHEPDTASEDAVKGTGTDADGSADEMDEPAAEPDEPTEDDESAATADADDESESAATVDTDESESVTSDDDESESVTSDDDESETITDETDAETEEGEESEGTAATSEEAPDVQSIDGIGPAYAERLGEAGIETVADLRAADAPTIAEESGIAESRVSTWIERAGQ
ncbi:helix-hairpin-helix domain-containing protein [Halorhabdus amylolytica]|uniref:helix-hairpin-helix domain-containing protein n=1 Tax=Halorhabdus amylolytica TaxID=2559573 RepID=UPI0010AA5BE2|nr:helix-hairpin-helix domain-containing protein [Halorhabdus amylolytica]